MAMSKRKTKNKARARTGLAGAPIDKGFDAVKYYFHIEIDRKDLISTLKSYVKANVDYKNQKFVFANPDYKFYIFTHYCATAFWISTGLKLDEKSSKYAEGLYKYVMDLVESGKAIYFEKQAKLKDSANVVTLSPMQRLQKKISNTIMQDLLDLEDAWMDGEKAEIDIYQEFKRHGLPASAAKPVREVIEGWLVDYEDAYHKRCDQAVEGYSHLKRSTLNQRIKTCKSMLEDLERIRSATKASRNVKVKGSVAIDKQVSKVQYKKEDTDFKIVSINPIQVPNKTRLYTFNCKYKVVTEYITDSPNGFIISGSTIKNFNKATSRSVKLRKPLDFLPSFLSRTPKQIDDLWKLYITTKTFAPNGRINKDTILLRVLDK